MRKRFLSVLLTLCMVLTLLPLASFAADGDTPEVDTSGLEVTEVGAFASAENFLSYVNDTYYLNEGSGIPTDDVSPNTMFVRLSEAVPENYKLYILVRSADDQTAVGSWYIESPKSFAYFTDATLAAGTTYTVRLGIYTEFVSTNAADDIFWEHENAWAKGSTGVVARQVTVSNTAKTAAPGTITLTENGLAADAKSTITWTNADNDSSKITAKIGAPVSFTVTAPQKYAVKSVTVGGEAAELAEGKYSFVMNGATEAVVVTYESTEIAEVQLALDTSDIAADTAVAALPSATISSITLTGASSAITNSTEIAKYVTAVTAWTDSNDAQLSGNLTANQQIKYTITVTAKSSSEAAYALAANAVKVTNVTGATVTDNVASGTVTVPAAAEKYTIKFAPGEGASSTMADVKVDKAGSGETTYTIPDCTFTAPSGKTFDKWTVNEITGVTISEDGKTLTIGADVAVSTEITLTAAWKTTAAPDDPDALTVEFGKVTEQTDLYGKTPGDLGVFDIKTGTGAASHTITVTGSANYISGYEGFSSVADEQNGHYLPINIAVSKAAKVTITGSGEAKEVNLTEGDKTIQLVMRLDEIAALEAPAKNTFTVAVEGDTTPYTVDVSGVALLPEVVKDEETGVSESTVTKDDNLDKLIAETDTTGDNTPAQAPVKVEVSGGNKTLTFDGTFNGTPTGDTSNNGHKVTLPQELAEEMGKASSDSKADVKVNSGVGSVTIPSAALTDAGANVTVSIEKADGSEVDATNVTIREAAGTSISADEKTAITTAIAGATGVSVEAKKGSTENLIAAGNTDKIIEIVIGGLTDGKIYTVLCVDNGTVTSFGEYTAESDGTITIGTKHLTEWYPIDNSTATTDTIAALAKVAADGGKATPPTSSSINIAFDGTNAATTGLTKATVTGLTGSGTVTVQVAKAADTAPAVVFTMTANASGEVEFSVNKGSEVTVWDGTVTFTNGVPVAPPNSATATAN